MRVMVCSTALLINFLSVGLGLRLVKSGLTQLGFKPKPKPAVVEKLLKLYIFYNYFQNSLQEVFNLSYQAVCSLFSL